MGEHVDRSAPVSTRRHTLPCLQFQAELAAQLRAAGHRIVEEFPVGARRGDILDLTTNEWLETDRVLHPLESVAQFRARLASEGATFRQAEVATLRCRKVLIMQFLGPVHVEKAEVRRAASDWLSDCPPGAHPDEIRISLREDTFAVPSTPTRRRSLTGRRGF